MTLPTKNFIKMKYFLKSGDAVAEVLDFVTVVGILIISFSIIGLAGYPALKSAQESRYTENTRQSFILMANSINKVALGQTPARSVELKMYGGSLKVTGNSTIKVNATRYNSTTKLPEEINLVDNQTMRSIENSIGDTVVAYEGTGVWVKYPTGTILNAYRPLITNRSDVLVIPVVYVTGTSSTSGSSMSEVSFCQQQIPSEEGGCGAPNVILWSNVSNITITIKGSYTAGWQDYFKNTMKWNTSGGYTARLNTTTNLDVYVLNARIYAVIR
jgi:hypothetical protein